MFILPQLLGHTKGLACLAYERGTHISRSCVTPHAMKAPGSQGPGCYTSQLEYEEQPLHGSWGFAARHLPTVLGKAVQSERSCAAADVLLSSPVIGRWCPPELQSCLRADLPLESSVFPRPLRSGCAALGRRSLTSFYLLLNESASKLMFLF